MSAALGYPKDTQGPPLDREGRIDHIGSVIGIDRRSPDRFVRSLPFCAGDATAGAENEFQAVVSGRRQDVDLARCIESSNYYKNLVKQAQSGDTPAHRLTALDRFLEKKDGGAWENSWVWFPRRVLNPFANRMFNQDLKADKSNPSSGYRKDAADFIVDRGRALCANSCLLPVEACPGPDPGGG